MQDKSLGLAISQGQVSQGYGPSQVLLAETSRGTLGYLRKPRGSELYTSRCFVKLDGVGSGLSSKPLLKGEPFLRPPG